MEDSEAQQDELLVLASIYDEKVFSASLDGELPGGQFSACLELPAPFQVKEQNASGQTEQHTIQHLPPITLCFQFREKYPSAELPTFTLSCKWLTRSQLSRLCQHLDELGEENRGEVVLFHWFNFLKDESYEYLSLSSPLDITDVVCSRKKSKSVIPVLKKTDSLEEKNPSVITNSVKEDNSSNRNHTDDAVTFDPRAIQDIAHQGLLLPTILEYDKEQRIEEFKGTLFTCSVCFMEKLGELCIKFPSCDHVYCKECMKGYFEVQINEGSVKGLVCPYDKCDSQADPSQVKELVSAELFSRYDRLLLQSSLDTMTDITYCPRKVCGCAVLLDKDAGMGSCAACNYNFCIYCKLAYHGVSPCRVNPDEVRKIREEYEGSDPATKKAMEQRYGRKVIKQIIEESMAKEWLEEHSKKCPHCKAHIQKIDGCNKMTCFKCRAYFCWICGSLLNKANPYSHFNSLASPCFNRLFQGVVMDDDEFEEDWED